ncbi:MAG: Flp pilus assembly complex ATPase component TadA [Candidatus Omnitrophica bacterium]|nr:Flp pilus assembly complex ATPase component TadA [Candidatus Omnitrophota bacterium]
MLDSVRERILKAITQLPNVKPEDIELAVDWQKKMGIGLGKALVDRKLISEKELMILLVRELHIPSIDLSKYRFDPNLKTVIPEKIARQYNIIPISKLGDTITMAISDPLNVFAIDDIKNITGKNVDVVMGTETQILKAINNFYGAPTPQSVSQISKDIDIEDFKIVTDGELSEGGVADADSGEQAPIIRMVNLVIKEAIKQRASDIHLEPTEQDMRVRYRIDGILQDILNIPKESEGAVVIRLKIMARLDITATHVPQDGRFKMRIASQEVDFRVSVLPTTHGSKIVMRILDKANLSLGFIKLGFSARAIEIMQANIAKPFGMILVTGPTGSGKSTTLYSIINQLNTVDKNIITVEDPVEYLIEGLTQIEVKPDIGLTFASGLRAILRQSPDIVMVGEIRDAETADIAIKASLTGQMVFSTLHTNDAAGALTRLVDMGVEPFLVASSLVMVCAQRLCRKICPYCKRPVEIPDNIKSKISHKIPPGMIFYEGKGCESCRFTGFLGRLGITEILEMDDAIREMLLKGKSSDDIKNYAIEHKSMKILYEDIVDRLCEGQTTAAEVFRVTSDEH